MRSAGGWFAVKMLRRSGLFQKADERILGNGDFVEQALDRAKERLDPAYDSIALGYDFNKIVQRVADLLDMSEAEVLSSAKRRATGSGNSPRHEPFTATPETGKPRRVEDNGVGVNAQTCTHFPAKGQARCGSGTRNAS